MKLTYRLFRKRSGIYFCEDRVTRRQESLHTREKAVATQLINAKTEARRQPLLNQQIARAYLDYGYTMKAIGDACGLHYSRVSIILRNEQRKSS